MAVTGATKMAFDRDAPKIGNYVLGNTLGHGTFGKVKGWQLLLVAAVSNIKIVSVECLLG